jgi:anti-sigma factor RsiW
VHLDAYLHGELPRRARRRVAQHLSECSECYAEYVAHRNLSQDIEAAVRGAAQPNNAQMSRIWQSIQVDMNRPTPVAHRIDRRITIAAFILMLTLLLPWSLDTQPVAHALPLPPSPAVTQTSTPMRAGSPTEIAVRLTDPPIPPAETPVAPVDPFSIP